MIRGKNLSELSKAPAKNLPHNLVLLKQLQNVTYRGNPNASPTPASKRLGLYVQSPATSVLLDIPLVIFSDCLWRILTHFLALFDASWLRRIYRQPVHGRIGHFPHWYEYNQPQ
jgi:hypothetical protein